MKTSDFNYDLPDKLIAQSPAEPRDRSRLLAYNSADKSIADRQFRDIIDYLNTGDMLVINDTKVIPARLFARREGYDGEVEILLLKRIDRTTWEAITKPAKKLKVGTKLILSDDLRAEIKAIGEQGIRIIEFSFNGVFEEILDRIGNMPLPPYITEKLKDKSRYQTVYCNEDGSSAAPTAGLHFTADLLDKIASKGIEVVRVLLHVGLGTFRPVKVEDVSNHEMHSEYCRVSDAAATQINTAKKAGRRIVCVGTTSVRVLESMASDDGVVAAGSKDTNIFIYPGYKFKIVDALITNFHLPESTLLMLVSALIGRENMMNIYLHAVDNEYRFFSFGDSMILY